MQIHFEIYQFYNLKIFQKFQNEYTVPSYALQMLFKQYQMNMFNNVNTECIQNIKYKVTLLIQTTCLEFHIKPVI